LNEDEIAHLYSLVEESVKGVARVPHQAYEQIRLVHNDTVGHNGVETTLDRLSKKDQRWQHMRRDVMNFIRRCPLCQKISERKKEVYTSPFTTSGYAPFQRVAIDSIGPLPVDETGNKHILVIIDSFSRYAYLVPVPDLQASTAARALLQFTSLFGVASAIVSDNGSQFVNETIKSLFEALQIEHIRINAYSHEENGLVERVNKEIMRYLRAIANERKIKRTWSQSLPFVQRIINAQIHGVLGVSTAQIIFGNVVDLD
jgi:IS30 family transposase